MKFRYYLQEPDFRVRNIDVQNVSRPKNYKHTFPNGREKHGFIYVVDGCITDLFHDRKTPDLVAFKGELVFIPKGIAYTGVYAEEHTHIKIIQFDLICGELPSYLSAPVKIELPRAYELIDAFFKATESTISYHPFYYLSCFYELLWRIDECCASIPKKYRKLQKAKLEFAGN